MLNSLKMTTNVTYAGQIDLFPTEIGMDAKWVYNRRLDKEL